MALSPRSSSFSALSLCCAVLCVGALLAPASAAMPNWTHRSGLAYSMLVHAQVALPSEDHQVSSGGTLAFVDAPGSALACFDKDGVISYTTLLQGPAGPAFQLACASNDAAKAGIILKVYDAAQDCVLNVAEALDFRGYSVYGDIMQPQLLHAKTATCGGAATLATSSTVTSSAASQTSVAPPAVTATEGSTTIGDVTGSSTSSASSTAAHQSSSTMSTSVPAVLEHEATSSVGSEPPSPAPSTASTTTRPLASGQNQTEPTPAAVQDAVDCHECEERTVWLGVGLGAATLLALVLGALLASLLQRQRRALAARGAVSPGSMSPPLAGGGKGKDADESFPGSFANPLFYDGPVVGGTQGDLRGARSAPIYVPPPSVSSEAIDFGETEA